MAEESGANGSGIGAGGERAIALLGLGLSGVVLVTFLYLAQQPRGPQAAPGPIVAANARTPAAPAGPGPLASAGGDAAVEHYVDARYGFEASLPAGWRRATPADSQPATLAAGYDVVWEAPETGARLAVSAWDAADRTSFALWAALVGAGMQRIAGEGPTNAIVANRPALLLWAAETPTAAARYALLFERSGTYYRVAYGALDGGAALGDYARLLATLRWPDSPATPAMVPLVGSSEGPYWPSERLFGTAGGPYP